MTASRPFDCPGEPWVVTSALSSSSVCALRARLVGGLGRRPRGSREQLQGFRLPVDQVDDDARLHLRNARIAACAR